MMWHDNDWQGWYHDDVSWKTAGDLVAPDAQCAHEAHDDVEKDKSVALTKSKRVKKNANRRQHVAHAEDALAVSRQTLPTQTSSSSSCVWTHANEANTTDVVPEAPGKLEDTDGACKDDQDHYHMPDCASFIRHCQAFQHAEHARKTRQLKGTKINMDVSHRRTLACKFVDMPISPPTFVSRQSVVPDAYVPYEEEQLRQWANTIINETTTFLNS